jgi:hypothetical protein
MRPRTAALLVTAVMVVYLALMGQVAVWLFQAGTGLAISLAVAVFMLPVVGIWIAVVNLRFGIQVERLARRLADEGGLPDTSALPRRPSGRIESAAAVAWFDERKTELDEEPTDWRRWYRLAQAYDLAGDRRRGWESMRQALRLSARSGGGSPATSAGPGSVTRPAG